MKATKKEKEVLTSYLLPFLNLQKHFPLLPGIENAEAVAHLMGLEEEELVEHRQRFTANAKEAAIELLEDEEVAQWMNELPFEGDETIVALGDSITDDLQGWFYILEHLLNIAVEGADFTFINSGVSYDTTTDALKRLDRDVMHHQPDWVLIALGTFDVQRLKIAPDRTLVSLADFWENSNIIEQAVTQLTDNPPVWITPPPVISDMLEDIQLFNFDLSEQDLKGVREILTGKKGFIVDPLGNRMGEGEPEAWNYLSDGLHPSVSGHVHTVKALLRHLTQTKNPQEG